ncbi:MAG: argininosuccinate lyase [Armatimonadota bacterium]|nr:argininosuccinate lyase [Armatimonadota bacterium]MDR7403994.1 argininosuccinate lyase [Armatimonadota bacterium]
MDHRMWGGRFAEDLDPALLQYTASFDVDRRLLPWDVVASIAHARMLGETGIIPASDAAALVEGLRTLLADVRAGRLAVEGPYEDVHTFVEAVLYRRLGPVAGRLHTARSRNDQVATAFRLYVREQIVRLVDAVAALMAAVADRAASALDVLLPAYTHLQRAQPVRLAHHLLAYLWTLDRDADRLMDCYRRADVLPLGSGAAVGVSFPVDRALVADLLGFARISPNSVDATGDRDFAVEVAADAALLMVHLSRWAEELVLWSTEEFGFVALADRVATGSSLMPHKKNPDVAELIRGRAGRVIGCAVGLLAALKGLPPGYQRDLQEDKALTMEALDLAAASVRALQVFLEGVEFVPSRMEAALQGGVLTATEVADYLARRGMPFREAHQVAGRLVREALERGCALWDLPLEVYRSHSHLCDRDILDAVRPLAAVEAKNVPGGTARASVRAQLDEARQRLEEVRRWIEGARRTLERAAALGAPSAPPA